MYKLIFSLNLLLFTYTFANDNIEKYFKLNNFTLEKSSLKNVLNTLGKTKIIKSGDASTSSRRLNYFIKKNNYYITFDSGEMGGGELITSFIISKEPPKENYKTISNKNFPLWNDLKLNISKIEFLKIVKNLEKNNNTWFYEKSINLKSNNQRIKEEDILMSITPKFINKKLVKFEIYKVTTY